MNLKRELVATIERKTSSSKRIASRIEKTLVMSGEVLKVTIVEKMTSRSTTK